MQLTTEEIVRLSPSERLKIIDQLWTSLDEADVPVTPAQKAELDRRVAMFEQERAQSITWQELKAELARRP